jgi:E3 ubiquitin-protein ligase RNF14
MMTLTNDQEQEEELAALQAIFPDELTINDSLSTVHLSLPTILETPLFIAFTSTTKARKSIHKLSSLPPIHLNLQLPAKYPSDAPPVARLKTDTCGWLPYVIKERLEQDIQQQWEDAGRSPVLFSYATRLQEASSHAFGLADTCTPFHVDEEVGIELLKFNKQAIQKRFEKGTFLCSICLELKKGSSCYRMHGCSDVFCTSCLHDFYTSAIIEGNIQTVKCLAPGCDDKARSKQNELLKPQELLQIGIKKEVVQRFMDLKLKRALEKDPETVWCPRKWCPGVSEQSLDRYAGLTVDISTFESTLSEELDEEEDVDTNTPHTHPHQQQQTNDRLAICGTCTFAFCSTCLTSWHGHHISCLPYKPTILLSRNDQKSLQYINFGCSHCPGCEKPYERTYGCDHMTCPYCGTDFCYQCSGRLGGEGYEPWWHVDTNGECRPKGGVRWTVVPVFAEAELLRTPKLEPNGNSLLQWAVDGLA